jgi:hypothetical protein
MNISFVVNNLSNSELSYELISAVNKNSDCSNAIFFQNNLPSVIQPECLTMNITGLSGSKGKAVAFDLESAAILLQTNTKTTNYLYLYDLEWLFKPINYVVARQLMDNFTVFARSEDHASVISNFLNKKVEVIAGLEDLFQCLKLSK